MLGAAELAHLEAQRLLQRDSQGAGRSNFSVKSETPATANTLWMPAYSTRLDDVTLLLRLATEQGVTIGPIDYRSETNPALPVVVREMDLRLNEEYPKFKAFVAEILKQMPHLYVREIQIELGAKSASKVQATLKLSAAYLAPVGVTTAKPQ